MIWFYKMIALLLKKSIILLKGWQSVIYIYIFIYIYILGGGQCVQVSFYPLFRPHNVIIEPLNVSKNKGTIECDNSTGRCDVGTV